MHKSMWKTNIFKKFNVKNYKKNKNKRKDNIIVRKEFIKKDINILSTEFF